MAEPDVAAAASLHFELGPATESLAPPCQGQQRAPDSPWHGQVTDSANSSEQRVKLTPSCSGAAPRADVRCSPYMLGLSRGFSAPALRMESMDSRSLRTTASWRTEAARTGVEHAPTSARERASEWWLYATTLARSTGRLVAGAPLRTLLVPLLVLTVCLIVSELGLWAAANNYRSQRETDTASTANSVSLQLDFLLQSYITPAIAVGELVARQPYVPDLMQDADVWMSSIVKNLDPMNTTTQVSVFPWNIKGSTYPATASLVSGSLQTGYVGADYNLLASRNQTVVWAAEHWTQAEGYMDLLGPLPPSPENCAYPGFCAREVLWLPTSNPNETWGNEVAFTTPWAMGPDGPIVMGNVTVNPQYRTDACGSNCSAYDNKPLPDGQQLVYWGFVLHCVCMSSLTAILDPLMAYAENGIQYKFVLYRDQSENGDPGLILPGPVTLDSAGHQILYESNGTTPRATETQSECRQLGAQTSMQLSWHLCLAPADGYDESQARAVGYYVAVALVSLVVALLVFTLMIAMENHRLLVKAMLPARVVRCLRLGKTYAEPFKNVTVLFSDIVSWTELSTEMTPDELVTMLDKLYSGFDDLVDKHQLYKVETIGDAFMCVGGAPKPCHPLDAAIRVARMALDMIAFTDTFVTSSNRKIQIRVGIYTGPATAAVVGRKMPHWTLVGDTVNVSSRMETNSKAMQVTVGSTTAALLSSCPEFVLEPRGVIDIKGKGPMSTFWLRSAGPPCLLRDEDSEVVTPSHLKVSVSAQTRIAKHHH